jgi:ABC-type uncharacterized transport system substrate-binding protein
VSHPLEIAARGARKRLLVEYADRILRGAAPAELPIGPITERDLVIILNLRAAEAIGLTIPQSIAAQATAIVR